MVSAIGIGSRRKQHRAVMVVENEITVSLEYNHALAGVALSLCAPGGGPIAIKDEVVVVLEFEGEHSIWRDQSLPVDETFIGPENVFGICHAFGSFKLGL